MITADTLPVGLVHDLRAISRGEVEDAIDATVRRVKRLAAKEERLSLDGIKEFETLKISVAALQLLLIWKGNE